MAATYSIGDEVMIKPVKDKGLSVREAALSQYAGTIGTIVDYHWMRPPAGAIFYLYTVQTGDKEIVLYEDEIAHIFEESAKPRKMRRK